MVIEGVVGFAMRKRKVLSTWVQNRRIHTHMAPLPRRTQVDNSSLIMNGDLHYFRSGAMSFSDLLQRKGQAYFDRTRYISVLHEIDNTILFFRPRRFGKSLTISMLEHFHGLQYANEHQSFYEVCNHVLDYSEVRTYFYFIYYRVLMYKRILQKGK